MPKQYKCKQYKNVSHLSINLHKITANMKVTKEMCSSINMPTHFGRSSHFPFRANCKLTVRVRI